MHFSRLFLLFLIFISSQLISRECPYEFNKKVDEVFEEGDPSSVVFGCVNAVSGMFSEVSSDLEVLHGVDPYAISRTWCGTTRMGSILLKGWLLNVGGRANYGEGKRVDDGEKIRIIAATQDTGGIVYLIQPKSSNNKTTPYLVDRISFDYGITNLSHGYASGQTNLKNWKATFDKKIKITEGNGKRRNYEESEEDPNVFTLAEDILPSGNSLSYFYKRHNQQIQADQVRFSNRDGFSEYKINLPDIKTVWKSKEYRVELPNGQWMLYHMEKDKVLGSLIRFVERSNAPKVEYDYFISKYYFDKKLDAIEEGLIGKKSFPEGRFLEIEYYQYGHNAFRLGNISLVKSRYDPRIGRVKCLKAPAGPNNSVVPLYFFSYHLNTQRHPKNRDLKIVKEGYTQVYDAYHRCTQYDFNAEQRLFGIKKYLANGDLYTHEHFIWGKNGTPDSTCILARALCQGNGNPLYAHTYTYDVFGNVIEDSFYGNFTGLDVSAPVLNGNTVTHGGECYKKTFTYSKDGYNLPLTEFDGVRQTTYRYAPKSNRLIAKYVGSNTTIYQRSFYRHNESGAVVEEMTDDGSSLDQENLENVTERKIIRYEQRKSYPVAYPDRVEEWCLDLQTGTELLIKKVVNTYSKTGKIIQQEHYGSDGVLGYTLFWDFDSYGNVIKEIDALGRVIVRKFDANCNCIYEKGPHPDCHKKFCYDAMNRLVREEQIHKEGVCLTTTHQYDLLGNRTATVDPYGNEIRYEYDDFNRLIKTIMPPTLTKNGVMKTAVLKKQYDHFNNVTAECDAKGNCTSITHTLRKKPSTVVYPDGSVEKTVYNLNGTVAEKITKNGTKILYTYDPLGRIINADTVSAEGELLQSTQATYSGFHLLTETDAMGVVTSYEYEPSGKIKSKRTGSRLTEYEYDSLGRRAKTIEVYGDEVDQRIIHLHEFDLLDRVVEESTLDGRGNVSTRTTYGYDVSGNICEVSTYTDQGKCTTLSQYDSHGTPVKVIDSQGNVTTTRCRYDYKNAMGQGVGYKEVTDPLGNTLIVIQDALGRIVEIIKKDPFGVVTQKKENIYDLNGNCCRIVESILSTDRLETELSTVMEYDSMNRLKAQYQAFGTPEQKTFSLSYTLSGNKATYVKCDGTVLTYTYDPLERLSSVFSSDQTVHDVYTYDLHDHPIQVNDLIHRIKTDRKFDAEGRLIEEALGNGQQLRYSYDYLGRMQQVTLPDETGVGYDYRGILLGAVKRLDEKSNVLYAHSYLAYDQAGRVTRAQMIKMGGPICYSYDPLGRLTQIETNHWKEFDLEYDPAGNLKSRQIEIKANSDAFNYTYDALYQLISEKGPSLVEYEYDSHYNRLTKNHIPARYNILDQLIDDGADTYHYDLNGNMVKKGEVHYFYDAYDRLISVSDKEQLTTYVYDSTHRRLSKAVQKNDETHVVRYLYQGKNEIGSVDETGKIVELRLFGVGKGAEIGASVAMELQGTHYVPLHDHNGNIAALLDGITGALVEHYTYTAFGEYPDDALSPWLFCSKRHDPETGFVYFGRRYYNPPTARWISEDPLGIDAGPNRYAFVHNNPLTHIDLYGLMENGQDSFVDRFSNGMQQFGNTLSRAASFLGQIPGRTVELFGENLVPIPYVKDVVAFAGHCLQGRNPTEFTPSWKRPHSQGYVHQGYGDNPMPYRIAYVNGMLTSFDEFKTTCAAISARYGGTDVHGIYKATHGLSLDCLEYLCQKLGIRTHAQEVADREMRSIIDGEGENPQQKYVKLYAHSLGALITHNLSGENRGWTSACALGPARILNSNDFANASNHCCNGDFISPLADTFNFARGSMQGSINFMNASSYNPLVNHSILGGPYERVFQRDGNRFKEKYGYVETVGP